MHQLSGPGGLRPVTAGAADGGGLPGHDGPGGRVPAGPGGGHGAPGGGNLRPGVAAGEQRRCDGPGPVPGHL